MDLDRTQQHRQQQYKVGEKYQGRKKKEGKI